MDPEMSNVKKRIMSSNVRMIANGYYLTIRAYKVTRLENQIKGYIIKSRSSEVLSVLEMQAWTILKTASVLAIAI